MNSSESKSLILRLIGMIIGLSLNAKIHSKEIPLSVSSNFCWDNPMPAQPAEACFKCSGISCIWVDGYKPFGEPKSYSIKQ